MRRYAYGERLVWLTPPHRLVEVVVEKPAGAMPYPDTIVIRDETGQEWDTYKIFLYRSF